MNNKVNFRTRVYVAGAYSADNVIDVLKNIGRGQHYAAKIFKAGFAPFCPWHDKDYIISHWSEEFTVEEFYDYSISWMIVCDVVFVIPGWHNSKGTINEIALAKERGIDVVFSINDLHKHLK